MLTTLSGHISNSSLATCCEPLLPKAPWILEACKKSQTGHTTSEFDIPTTMHHLSAETSYPPPTVTQSTPLIKPDNLGYTTTVAPSTYTGTKYSLTLTMGSANDQSFPSSISTEALPEDGAIDGNKIQAELNTAQSVKSSVSLSDGLMIYPSIFPSTGRKVAELTDISAVSNEYTSITLKASNALPGKVQLTTDTFIVSTQRGTNRPTTSTNEYLLASSPTWVVSDRTSHLQKAPERFMRQESVSGNTHIFHEDLAWNSSRVSGCPKYIQQEGETSVLYDSSGTFAAYTSTSLGHGGIPNSASLAQTSTTDVSPTSSTPDAKSSNGDDLTTCRNKGSHYIEKRTLGIVLGSVSGAGIVLCAILVLHRLCYRRFRGARKRMMIPQNPDNLNVRNASFAGHSDQREISRFSVDS